MNEERRRLLAKAAYFYYVEGQNQEEVAQALNVNRTTVSRMLLEAKTQGIVQFVIQDLNQEVIDLEREFKKRFQIEHFDLTPSKETDSEAIKNQKLAINAADFLLRYVQDQQVIGVSWGSTLSSVVEKMTSKKLVDSVIVPLVGGPSHMEIKHHVNTIVYEMSKRLSAKSVYVNAEAVQDTALMAKTIMNSRYFEEVKSWWPKIDLAIFGIGGHFSGSRAWRDSLIVEDVDELMDQGVVGDLMCRFFDLAGNLIDSDVEKRTVGMQWELLENIPLRFGIGRGHLKADAIFALLNSGRLNGLATDEETAREIISISDHLEDVKSGNEGR